MKLKNLGLYDLSLQNRQIGIDNKNLLQSQFAIAGLFFEKKDLKEFILLFNTEKILNDNPYNTLAKSIYDNKKLIIDYAKKNSIQEKDWSIGRNQRLLEKALIAHLIELIHKEYICKKKDDYHSIQFILTEYIFNTNYYLVKESFIRSFNKNIFSKSNSGVLNISIMNNLDFKSILLNTNEIIDNFIYELSETSNNRLFPFLHMEEVEELLMKEFI